MKRTWILAAILAFAPIAATATEPTSSGAGPHGYEWLAGTWTCTNAARATIGGPSTQTITVTRSIGGSLAVRVSGAGFERSGYIAYDAGTQTWWRTFSYPNGNHYAESTSQSGAKSIWTGPYTDVATDKTFMVRDTYTIASPTQFTDVGEYQSSNSWHTGYTGTCKKH